MLSRERITKLKEQYPEGTAVRLARMNGEDRMPSGLRGKVRMVDDIGQIHVLWENGSQLALNVEEDVFETIHPQEAEEKWQEAAGEVYGMNGLT